MDEAEEQIELLTARELSRSTKDVLERIEKGVQFIIVRRGQPVACIGQPSRAMLEAYVFANSPEIRASIEQAEEEIAEGKSVPLVDETAEVRRRLGDPQPVGSVRGHTQASPGRRVEEGG